VPPAVPYRPATPTYVNPGLGDGPLGTHDADNFHP
jgi:hypothetical protein